MTPRRILLATIGSLGDLHPYIALGKALLERGHRVVLATHGFYRAKVEGEGLAFAAVRPDFDPKSAEYRELVARVMNRHDGPRVVFRDMIMPALRDAYADTLAAADGCDLLVSHPLTLSVRLIAETTGRPWAATVLAPVSFFSMDDPPVMGGNAVYGFARWLGPWALRPLFGLIKRVASGWAKPYHALRRELGLSADIDPIFAGQFSPSLNLALFSTLFAKPQRDWPANTLVTGYCFYDRDEPGKGMSAELRAFLDRGPPPVVFTLGSSAVHTAGNFYVDAVAAVQRLGCRAVLLVGNDGGTALPSPLPKTVHVEGYAPHSELFPRASAIVHQCGAGTMGQALRAGKPMLAVPWAHDQPDNADHARRLGVARVLPAHQWNAGRAFHHLFPLLNDAAYATRAAEVGQVVAAEDGAGTAADALAGLLS